ncbi:MAG: hypothetical protein II670_09665, partial [Alphaproteobacteria bacterium]|nr:hypothetical protein [Alphaproteobacteria bacterium]
KAAWRKCGNDKEMLVKLALQQQSLPFFSMACFKNLGLTKDYIKKEFKDYINGYVVNDADGVKGYTYGLYVDWDYENDIDVNVDVCGIMWTVGANVVVQETKCPVLYVSNRSNLHLVCEGYNSVNIKLFDNSKITIEDLDENSNVVVYKYSDGASVELGEYCLGKVKVFNKKLRL